MNALRMWRIFLIRFWIPADCQINTSTGTDHLSEEVIQVLKDEENPKCFTRRGEDFTCFFETKENKNFHFFYQCAELQRKKCEVSVHETDNGTFLHVCSFPKTDVFMFTETEMQVMDPTNNSVLYSRTVHVEDHYLLKPPFKISVKPNGQVGELKVSWDTEGGEDLEKEYRIRYSSGESGEKTKHVKDKDVSLHLVPGEEIKVQVSVKASFSPEEGHWSSWSKPVGASVPQSADDISLVCSTSDLHNVTCHWNETRYETEIKYKLFYKTTSRNVLNWTEWSSCLPGEASDVCHFSGDEFSKIKVKLSSTSEKVNRTFFSQEFMLRNSIKTAAPGHLRGVPGKGNLCLDWKAPLPSLKNHLQYEVKIKIKGGEQWSTIKGPETNMCVKAPPESQFSVQIRVEPTGTVYSGYWSDWSSVLNGDILPDTDMLLMSCVLVLVMITAFIFISLFFLYCSKLKQFFWPPVPNLEKVLQELLVDINQQKWSSPVTTKHYFEDTTSSVVEIMSEGELPRLHKPSEESSDLLPSYGSFSSGGPEDGSLGSEVPPDYVTLNKELTFLCLAGNSYLYEQVKVKEGCQVGDELLHTSFCSCSDCSTCAKTFLGNTYFNQSYLSGSKCADINGEIRAETGPENPYTNLSIS